MNIYSMAKKKGVIGSLLFLNCIYYIFFLLTIVPLTIPVLLLTRILVFLLCDSFSVQELPTTIVLRHFGCVLLVSSALCSLMEILIVLVGSSLRGLHKTPLSNSRGIPTKGYLILYNKRSDKRRSFKKA